MLVRKQGQKKAGKICVLCYVRQGLLHCSETLELTVAGETKLHRVERCMIYIYYIYISYINIYRIYSRHRVSITWDLKPITLDLTSDTCSTELASLTQERSIQSIFTKAVTSKNTKLCQNVGNWAGLSPT